MRRFFNGFHHLILGVRTIFQTKSIVRVVVPPVVLNVLIFVGIAWILVRLASNWADAVLGAEWWYAVILSLLISLVILAVVVAVFMVAFVAITNIIGAPFYDKLADNLMKTGGGTVERTLAADVVYSVKTEIKKIVLFALIQLGLAFLNALPILGSSVYLVFWFLVTAFFLGHSYLDFALGRTRRTFRQSLSWSARHFPETVGFGCAIFIAFLVPILNAFMVPAAVAGGVLLYRDLTRVTEN